VSDFDGTLTTRDFYHIIIDKYLGDWGRVFYHEWKKTNKIGVEFLNKIFKALNLTENQLIDEIKQLPFDDSARYVIDKITRNGGDFYIVSAGTSYYIRILLEHLNIEKIYIISMNGRFQNNHLTIIPDSKSPFYSEIFGLDKSKVIKKLRQEYSTILFAGDSEPDFEAAKCADIVFAKNELADLLNTSSINYNIYNDYKDIDLYLQNMR
jgi:2,3-diketo-5-methylthio-1-phosphopentane phosphatase